MPFKAFRQRAPLDQLSYSGTGNRKLSRASICLSKQISHAEPAHAFTGSSAPIR